MTKEIKGAIVGIGAGVKAHMSAAIVSEKGMAVLESYCGSVKRSAWTQSRTYGNQLSEQSFPYINAGEFTWGSEEWSQARTANWKSEDAARKSIASELLSKPDACQKCAKHAETLLKAGA